MEEEGTQEAHRMEEEPYEDLFVPLRCTLPQKMLDSASSGRELPARNSSISSVSSDRPLPPPLGLRAQPTKTEDRLMRNGEGGRGGRRR